MATKSKTGTKTKKKTTGSTKTATKSATKKSPTTAKPAKLSKGKMIAAALVLAIGFASQMADAATVKCLVKINGNTLFDQQTEIPQEAGEPEGAGKLLLVDDKDTKVQVYVMNYPLQMVAVQYDMGVPVKAKRSNRLVDILSKFESSRVHTYMDGADVDAVCDRM